MESSNQLWFDDENPDTSGINQCVEYFHAVLILITS